MEFGLIAIVSKLARAALASAGAVLAGSVLAQPPGEFDAAAGAAAAAECQRSRLPAGLPDGGP